MEGKFHRDVFLSGFFANTLLAAFLAWLGDGIGVDLYLAAVVVLGSRIFLNLSLIRRFYLNQVTLGRQQKR
jgi:small basic protein